MRQQLQQKSSFELYKNDFLNETGLDANIHTKIYIAYYHARISEIHMLAIRESLITMSSKIEFLPTRIAETLKNKD